MPESRKSRALRVTLIMGSLLTILVAPFLYIYSTRPNYAAIAPLRDVAEFVVRDRAGAFLTHFGLKNKITLVLVAPAPVTGEAQKSLVRSAQNLAAWADQEFKPAHGQVNAFQLLALTGDDLAAGLPSSWRQIPFEETLAKGFFPEDKLPADLTFLLLDQEGKVRLITPLKSLSQSEIEQFSSALVFNHHLGEYLSKRTFMGPKKT